MFILVCCFSEYQCCRRRGVLLSFSRSVVCYRLGLYRGHISFTSCITSCGEGNRVVKEMECTAECTYPYFVTLHIPHRPTPSVLAYPKPSRCLLAFPTTTPCLYNIQRSHPMQRIQQTLVSLSVYFISVSSWYFTNTYPTVGIPYLVSLTCVIETLVN